MNREIKFRGKDLNGRWWYGDLIQTKPSADGHILTWIKPVDFLGLGAESTPTELFHDVEPVTVGLFTGLKDSEGNPIYEGDILEAGMKKQSLRGVMEWQEDGRWSLFAPMSAFKIIGNIHQTPELLK